MMSTTKNTEVTATRESDVLEPAVGRWCSPQVSRSPQVTIKAGISEAPAANTGVGKATAGGCAKQASTDDLKITEETATETIGANECEKTITKVQKETKKMNTATSQSLSMTRAQAEARYARLLEDILNGFEKLEASVNAATNTKTDIKQGTRAVGISLREFAKIAKLIGMTKSPDTTEERLRSLQLQQQQQHLQTLEIIKKLGMDRKQPQLTQGQPTETRLNALSQEVADARHETEDKFKKLFNSVADIKRLIYEQGKTQNFNGEVDGSNATPQHHEQHSEQIQQPHQRLNKRQRQKERNANVQDNQDEKNPQDLTPIRVHRRTPSLAEPRDQNNTVCEAAGAPGNFSTTVETGEWTTVNRNTRPKVSKKTVQVRQEAVIVKIGENSTYANTLKGVMNSLNGAGLTDEVDTVRKTKDGNLLLRMRKLTAKTSEVLAVAKQTMGAEVIIKTNAVAVEIRELDEDITKEELVSHISDILSAPIAPGNVKALKPSFGGKMMAVVLLPAPAANQLVSGPRLRIGWSSCKTIIRVPVIRCQRCLDFGHKRNTCSGPDRSNKCTNCWEMGHQRKDCEAEAHCGLCVEEGNEEAGQHLSGGGKCQACRRFLQMQKAKQ